MIPEFLKTKQSIQIKNPDNAHKFIDKTIKKAASVILEFNAINYLFNKKGFLQLIDARIKFICLLSSITLISINHNLLSQFIILFLISLYAILSNLNPIKIYKKALIPAFIFGFLVFLPSSLNIFVDGKPLFLLFNFKVNYKFIIYNIPQKIFITYEGIIFVIKITLKIFNSVSIVLLTIYTTGFDNLIKAIAFYKISPVIILILSLTFRFIFTLSKTLLSTYQSLKLRWFSSIENKEINKIIGGRIFFIFKKAYIKYEKIYNSMLIRNYNENFNIFYYEKLKKRDYFFLIVFLCTFVIIYFI